MATLTFCDVAKAKQTKREDLLPAAWRATDEQIAQCKAANGKGWGLKLPDVVLSKEELDITRSSAAEVLQHMWPEDTKASRWTVRRVLDAFAHRAVVAHQVTNCLTEVLFEQAARRADALDAEYARTGQRPTAPLAGLPISIKDNFNIRGVDSTLGFVCWANQPATYDALLVRCLFEQGAILYCKTNVPTAMMIAETVNNTFGRTLNPHNTDCSPGGSSGGEGALLAMRGSPLGVGTDIGGSIRIPGSLSALYTLKPSLGRFPTMDARSAMAGQEAVNSINGPMSADLASLSLFAAAVVGWQPWRFDIKCIPMPWTPVTLPRTGLVFGLLLDDGMVHPEPPITRALKLAAQQLERAGHTVVPFRVDALYAELKQTLLDMFGADGGAAIGELLRAGGEAERWVPGLPRGTGTAKTMTEMWSVQARRWSLGAKMCEAWQATCDAQGRVMDALLSPAGPHAAVQHDSFAKHVIYTGAWNLLDFCGATLPVTHVDAALDDKAKHVPSAYYSELDKDVWEKYDVNAMDGMPVTIQVVGRRLEEEKLLAVVQRIVEAL